MSTPSNSTLATSLKVLASNTRRNGDFPSTLRRTEERMTPVYAHAYQTDMIIWDKCMQLCLVHSMECHASADKLVVVCNQTTGL